MRETEEGGGVRDRERKVSNNKKRGREGKEKRERWKWIGKRENDEKLNSLTASNTS